MTPDAIDLRSALVVNSPRTIADWRVTRTITQIEMRPTSAGPDLKGLSFTFDPPLPDSWKWSSNPANPADNFQYTVWPVVGIEGRWVTSGIINMWKGKVATGGPLLEDFAKNWVYDSRWGPMAHHQPSVGEAMGFFVSAGNARGVDERSPGGGVTSVRERSNVVLIHVPENDTGVFTFAESAPPAETEPEPPPVVVTPPVDEPNVLLEQIRLLRKDIQQVREAQTRGLTGRIKFMGVTTTVTLKPPTP